MSENSSKNNRGKPRQEEIASMPFDKRWECTRCSKLLAFVGSEDENYLRIKYKDLYVHTYKPHHIGVNCVQCGHYNEISQENFGERYSFDIKDDGVHFFDSKCEFDKQVFTQENIDDFYILLQQL